MVIISDSCFLCFLTDGNTVTCCENKNVVDQTGNELRLCSAIDKERVQADEERNSTTFTIGNLWLEQPCPPNHTTAHFELTLVSCTTKTKTLFKGYITGVGGTEYTKELDNLRKKCNAKNEQKLPANYEGFATPVCDFKGNEWDHALGKYGRTNKCTCNDNESNSSNRACPPNFPNCNK